MGVGIFKSILKGIDKKFINWYNYSNKVIWR